MPKAREIEPTVPRALEAVCCQGDGTRPEQSLPPRGRPRRGRPPLDRRRTGLGASRSARGSRLALGPASPHAGDEPGGSARDRRDRPVGRRCAHRARARPHRKQRKSPRAAKIASANAARALHNLRLAQDAADGLLGEVADVDLADIPQMEPVRQRLLEKARAGYEQFLVRGGG